MPLYWRQISKSVQLATFLEFVMGMVLKVKVQQLLSSMLSSSIWNISLEVMKAIMLSRRYSKNPLKQYNMLSAQMLKILITVVQRVALYC